MASDLVVGHVAGRNRWRFLLHVFEMLIVMMIGMCALGGASRGLYSVASGHSFVVRQHPVLAALVMAIAMTLPMVLWMRFRGHAWQRGGEMGMAMFVPTLLALVVFWLGAISATGVLGLAMILMVPAMIAVMLYREEEYSAPHTAIAGTGLPRRSS